jgi:hypothetical protein
MAATMRIVKRRFMRAPATLQTAAFVAGASGFVHEPHEPHERERAFRDSAERRL